MITVTNDFITKKEEGYILKNIRILSITRGTNRNNITRYGSLLPYKGVPTVRALPEWSKFIIDRLMSTKLLDETPDHITVNEYKPTQGIKWHIDSKSSGEVITIISLKSDAEMGVRGDNTETKYFLSARSLLQMTEKERWEYEHCIYPVVSERISLVFRKGTEIVNN
jgi:alkylated DNA repair dioxygenase AlkB